MDFELTETRLEWHPTGTTGKDLIDDLAKAATVASERLRHDPSSAAAPRMEMLETISDRVRKLKELAAPAAVAGDSERLREQRRRIVTSLVPILTDVSRLVQEYNERPDTDALPDPLDPAQFDGRVLGVEWTSSRFHMLDLAIQGAWATESLSAADARLVIEEMAVAVPLYPALVETVLGPEACRAVLAIFRKKPGRYYRNAGYVPGCDVPFVLPWVPFIPVTSSGVHESRHKDQPDRRDEVRSVTEAADSEIERIAALAELTISREMAAAIWQRDYLSGVLRRLKVEPTVEAAQERFPEYAWLFGAPEEIRAMVIKRYIVSEPSGEEVLDAMEVMAWQRRQDVHAQVPNPLVVGATASQTGDNQISGESILSEVRAAYLPYRELATESGKRVVIVRFEDDEKLPAKWPYCEEASRLWAEQRVEAFAALGFRAEQEVLAPRAGRAEHEMLPLKGGEDAFKKLVARLNRDRSVAGVIVQSPPRELRELVGKIDKTKHLGRLVNVESLPIVEAIWRVVEPFVRDSRDQPRVAVVGSDSAVGREVGRILAANHVETLPLKTSDDLTRVREADIVISVTGLPDVLGPEHLRPHHRLVVDAGFVPRPDGPAQGEVRPEAAGIPQNITPVGGIAQVETAVMLEALLRRTVGRSLDPWQYAGRPDGSAGAPEPDPGPAPVPKPPVPKPPVDHRFEASKASVGVESGPPLWDGWADLNPKSSFIYHWSKHAKPFGVSRWSYARDAREWANCVKSLRGSRKQLKDGTWGKKYKRLDRPGHVLDGSGGIVDKDGKIVSFWYRDSPSSSDAAPGVAVLGSSSDSVSVQTMPDAASAGPTEEKSTSDLDGMVVVASESHVHEPSSDAPPPPPIEASPTVDVRPLPKPSMPGPPVWNGWAGGKSPLDTFQRNWKVYAEPSGISQHVYARDAREWATCVKLLSGRSEQLKDGTWGIKHVRLNDLEHAHLDGSGGIFDKDGKIVAFWYGDPP